MKTTGIEAANFIEILFHFISMGVSVSTHISATRSVMMSFSTRIRFIQMFVTAWFLLWYSSNSYWIISVSRLVLILYDLDLYIVFFELAGDGF